MKYKNVRVVRMPVIHDDNRHYFLNDDTGFCGVLAEDLPRPNPPINSIIDDIIEQQNCTIGVCPVCEDFVSDADNWIKDADNTYCSQNCYENRSHHPDVVTCDYCDCGINPDSPDAIVLADGNYCDVSCFNRPPCEFCNVSASDCHCFDG